MSAAQPRLVPRAQSAGTIMNDLAARYAGAALAKRERVKRSEARTLGRTSGTDVQAR